MLVAVRLGVLANDELVGRAAAGIDLVGEPWTAGAGVHRCKSR